MEMCCQHGCGEDARVVIRWQSLVHPPPASFEFFVCKPCASIIAGDESGKGRPHPCYVSHREMTPEERKGRS